MELQVKLEVFDGPLDLLLHLIEKNKVDIFDIPIVLITEQYLDYVRKIRYKNKIYKVKQEDTSKENKSDTVYVGGTLEEFVEKFEAKINYDFENKRVYLEIF